MKKVDVIAALDMHVERGEWEKCIQSAEQEVDGVFDNVVTVYDWCNSTVWGCQVLSKLLK